MLFTTDSEFGSSTGDLTGVRSAYEGRGEVALVSRSGIGKRRSDRLGLLGSGMNLKWEGDGVGTGDTCYLKREEYEVARPQGVEAE